MTRAASPFHAGEQTIQRLAGVRDRIELKGHAIIRDYMLEQHRAFFAALPFMVVGLADQNGHPWATTLSGPPGFMKSANEKLLTIKAWLDPSDPLHSCIRDGVPVGGLGIELSTRRSLRDLNRCWKLASRNSECRPIRSRRVHTQVLLDK